MTGKERLHAVLRLRKIREQKARAAMLREQLARAQASRDVRERRDALSAIRQPVDDIRPSTLRSLQLRGLAANELLDQAVDQERDIITRLEESRRHWHRTVAERDATEELLARRSQAAAYLARVAADRALDHLVAARGKTTR